MPRYARVYSKLGLYHIVIRGVNRQNIFESDTDRLKFIRSMKNAHERWGVEVIAYCLMSNHVHFLVRTNGELPDVFVKSICASYTLMFNKKYHRVGHLFQARYKSKAIDDHRYMLIVVRYIHNNPVKAGIASLDMYRWSSYREYLGLKSGFCEKDAVIEMLGGIEGFQEFMMSKDALEDVAEYDNLEFERHRLTDDEAFALAEEMFPDGLFSLLAMTIRARDAGIRKMKLRGMSAAQIARVAGISRSNVYRILEKKCEKEGQS